MAEVYWIRDKQHTNILVEGYVGVSVCAQKRWKNHAWAIKNAKHENAILTNAADKYGWENLVKEIVVISDESYCYDLENKLRPNERIGWNIAMGGVKPPVSSSRGAKYVSPLKGLKRDTPWMMGRTPANKGKPLSDEHAAKLAASHTGKKQSQEHVEKRVLARKATMLKKQTELGA